MFFRSCAIDDDDDDVMMCKLWTILVLFFFFVGYMKVNKEKTTSR